ncbi:MAG: VCBS repeat-containing protein [Pseudomonadota bacterium]|nr:VCBS repeat-containing protein [Pseudomonadota bacterium]
MPLVSLPVPLPPDAAELRAGDVDGDGRDELLVVSRTARPGIPDTVKLTVLFFTEAGALAARKELDLGSRPLLWDANAGLWGLDREGLVKLDPAGGAPTRVARFPTVLAALGPTTPAWAPLAHDLDGDEKPELIAWSAGRYLAFRSDGTALGGINAPAEGALALDWSTGGAATNATLSPPPLAVADLDGDGKLDLLLPSGSKLGAYFTGDTIGARAASLVLPLDLEPPEEDPKPGETRRRISGVWIEDLDGDGKLDLAVHRLVLAGSWFGATAELVWAKGRGDGFLPLQVVPVNAAAFGVELVDLDGDGDKDFVAPLVDIGIGTIARALLAKSARVDLSLFRMEGGNYQAPEAIRTFGYPLESPGRFQATLEADVDGDGRIDLVTNDAEDRVRVYRGKAGGLETAVAWEALLRVPIGDDTLFVHDLTGDGRAEIVVWGPKEATATVLRLP